MACLPQTTGGRLVQCAQCRADRRQRRGGAAACQRRCRAGVASASRRAAAGSSASRPRRSERRRAQSRPTGRRASICARCWRRRRSRWACRCTGPCFAEGQPDAILSRRAARRTPTCRCRPAATWWRRATDRVSTSQTWMSATRSRRRPNLVFNAGTLLVRAMAQRSGAPLGDAIIAISDAGQAVDGKKDAAGPPLAMFKGSEGLADAARRPLPGARRAGTGARRASGRGAGGKPGPHRRTPQRRAPAAVGRRHARAAALADASSSASSRTTPTRRRAGARWRGPPRGRPISCSRPAPTT